MRDELKSSLLLAALMVCAPAFAVDDGTKEAEEKSENSSVTYSGVGLVQAKTKFDNLKPAVNLNASLGFRIPTVEIFAVELEISTTVIPGSNSGPRQCSTIGGGGGGLIGGGSSGSTSCPPGKFTSSSDDLQMNNIGVFGVLRSPGKFYAMAKYGYRYLNTNIPELQQERSGNAYGFGGGYRWGKSLSGVELAYTKYSKEVTYTGFSISYGFGGRD